jgi:conserved plasmodium protein
LKKQKIFFGNKVEYNKITVNENKDGVFSEETIRVDVIKEKKDDVLFDIEDKSKEITSDKTIIVRTLENEGEKYKNETLENLEKKFKEEYDEIQNEENNELNKEEDLEKNKEEKENQNEINTVYQIENIIDGQESEVSQNTGVFDVSELNKKLEKENEIKFDEMYQKAFGTEVSEKRKERLKNEEKIDRKFYSKTSKK